MARSKDLERSVEALVDRDETVVGALVANSGPRPGSEAWLSLLGPLAGLAGVLALLGLVRRRRCFYVVGLTDRNVVKIETGRRPKLAPDSHVVRLPRDAITPPPRRTGDQEIQVAGESLWVTLLDSDEAVRLARLGRSAER